MKSPLYHNPGKVLTLPPGVIHLWCAFPDDIIAPRLLADYEALLSADERQRWQRFHFAQHRHHYLVTRALVRSTLSRYIANDPKDWRFSLNRYGKPEIILKPGDPPIRFNLSHTDGLVLCGIVLNDDIGVDAESRHRKSVPLEVAERYFSRQEAQELRRLPQDEQQQRFFAYWTLKEAYIKARGMGLSLPLDRFTFHIETDNSARISFDPELQDDPAQWRFWRLQPSNNHLAAVAVKAGAQHDYRLLLKTVVPLKEG